jgi:hypothetical protein
VGERRREGGKETFVHLLGISEESRRKKKQKQSLDG